MPALSIRLPASLHEEVRQQAAREGISINQFVTLTLAGRLAASRSGLEYLAMRARRGSAEKLREMLALAPDVPPMPGDELPVRTGVRERVRPGYGSRRKK